jgi:hypothetical protein
MELGYGYNKAQGGLIQDFLTYGHGWGGFVPACD